MSKNYETGSFYNYTEDGAACVDKSENNLSVADLNYVTDEAVLAIQMLNSRGLGSEHETEHAAMSSFIAENSLCPHEAPPLSAANDGGASIPSSIPSPNLVDMPTLCDLIKPSTSAEIYQPTTKNISDDEDESSPSLAKQQKFIETTAEMSWYMNIGKSLQTHYDFVELLKEKLQKSRMQFDNFEKELKKIGKSVTLLQSYNEKKCNDRPKSLSFRQ